MKSLREMFVGEVAAYVAQHLRQSDINIVLTGGSCVSIYADNRYISYDLDFIEEGRSTRKKIAACLREIGFQEKDRYFTHPDTAFFVEFPSGPLAIGDEPVGNIAQRSLPPAHFACSLRLIASRIGWPTIITGKTGSAWTRRLW